MDKPMEAPIQTKTCRQCTVEKLKTEFYSKSPDCKPCTLKKNKEYRDLNKERLNAQRRDDMKMNPEKYKLKSKKYREKYAKEITEKNKKKYEKNADIVKAKVKAYRDSNPDVVKERKKKYYDENKEKVLAKNQKWRENNPDELKRIAREYWRKRYYEDLEFKMMCILRSRARDAIKRDTKSASTLGLLGCSVEMLKDHLEAGFDDKMTWENYGTYWHVDHIIPCASFDLTDPAQQRECFNWSNLQPLEATENQRKGAKLDWVPAE